MIFYAKCICMLCQVKLYKINVNDILYQIVRYKYIKYIKLRFINCQQFNKPIAEQKQAWAVCQPACTLINL